MKMKTFQKITFFLLIFLPSLSMAETKEIPFTFDDRDRIIRTEQKVEALNVKIDTKIDGLHSEMNARFDQLFGFLWAIIGVFTTMMISIFGFAFWDRKLSLAPMKKENKKLLNALRD